MGCCPFAQACPPVLPFHRNSLSLYLNNCCSRPHTKFLRGTSSSREVVDQAARGSVLCTLRYPTIDSDGIRRLSFVLPSPTLSFVSGSVRGERKGGAAGRAREGEAHAGAGGGGPRLRPGQGDSCLVPLLPAQVWKVVVVVGRSFVVGLRRQRRRSAPVPWRCLSSGTAVVVALV